ncbi:MAG: glycosyltransferase family 39 protein [Lentimicrobium sp.]
MNLAKLIKETGNDQQKMYWLLVGIILLVALVLRVSGLGFSYSNDELSALVRVRFDSFSELVDKGFYVDGHPGGIQVFLFYWVKLFGMGEWAVRLPFAIGGVLAVYFAIRVFTRWFGPTTGLLTGAFMAFLEFPLVYSQIARPYGAGLLFSMMMTWFWTRLLFDEKPKSSTAVFYAISAAACMYSHYFSFLFALIVGITGLFFLTRKTLPYYIGSGVAAALLFTPHIYITLNHLSIGGVGLWLAKPENNWLLAHIWYIFNESAWIALIAGTVVLASFINGFRSLRLNRFHLFSMIFFAVPFLTGFFYSRMVNPVLQHSVLIFSFPFLIALLFSFADKLPSRITSIVVLFILFAGTFQTIAGNRYYRKQHFGEFRGVAGAIDQWNRTYGRQNITTAVNVNNPWYLNFYLDQTEGGRTTFVQSDNRGGLHLDTLARILDTCRTPYFIYAWTKQAPFEVNDMVLARFPCVVGQVNFDQLSEATLYSKLPLNCINEQPDTLYKVAFNPAILKIDSLEYSPGYSGLTPDLLKGMPAGHPENLIASVDVFSETPETGALLVVSFEDENGKSLQWQGARADLFCRPGYWSKTRLTVPLTDEKIINSHTKVYFWNPKKSKLLIKTLTITIEKPIISNNQLYAK